MACLAGSNQQSKGDSTMADSIIAPVLLREKVAQYRSGSRTYLNEYECVQCRNPYVATTQASQRGTRKCVACVNQSKRTHGMWKDARLNIWRKMVQRCTDPRNHAYKRYGGRGITVCPEWMTFDGFRMWSKFDDFKPGLEIDRIDNDGGYSPENCRWVTPQENSQNRRNNRLTPDKVNQIRALVKSGVSRAEAARLTGVSGTTAGLVVAGKTWGNVEARVL